MGTTNKIDIAVDNVRTKLLELVSADGSGELKSVERKCIVFGTVNNPPVLGLFIDEFWRETNTWFANALIMLQANKGDLTVDKRIITLAGLVDKKITELADSGSAGGVIDRPRWMTWTTMAAQGAGVRPVGAIGEMRIRVADPVVVET